MVGGMYVFICVKRVMGSNSKKNQPWSSNLSQLVGKQSGGNYSGNRLVAISHIQGVSLMIDKCDKKSVILIVSLRASVS